MSDFNTGVNDPCPVTRVIVFGYCDGVVDGVMQLGEAGPTYRFEFIDQRANPSGLDERRYELRPLPSEAFDEVSSVVGEHITPTWPVWLPIWKFTDEQVQEGVEQRVDAILELAAEPTWHITTADPMGFASVIATPVRSPARVA